VQHAPQLYAEWWLTLFKEHPGHVVVETALIAFVVYILFFKKTLNTRAPALGITSLTPKEVDELISEWQPEPLVPAADSAPPMVVPVVDKVEGAYYVMAETGQKLLNMVSFDFLGFGQSGELRAAAVAALERYGCGSCGPRGFYGTIDAHLK
jgi:serine palmitoyltransferase